MTIQLACPKCSAQFQVKDELAGRKARCAKCQNLLQIPDTRQQFTVANNRSANTAPPATEKQKEYAESLGINFPTDIDRRTISTLIDEAVDRIQDERYAKLNEIDNREGEAYEKIREEIVIELDEEDPRLSTATVEQLMESLNDKNISGVLIYCPSENIADLVDCKNDCEFSTMGSDDLDDDDIKGIVKTAGMTVLYRSTQE